MRARLLRIGKWLAFPAFYLFCLGIFGYLTFPYDRLKDRIVLELEKHGKPGQRLEVGKLTSYWFTGVALSNVKLHMPSESSGFGAAPAKESVLTIDEAHLRVRILPLLIGRVRLDFWASAFNGEVKGTAPVGDSKGDVVLELDHIDLGKVEMIPQMLDGVPIKGVATGKLELSATDGKFSKANGTLDLTISGVVAGDPKTKIMGVLPPAKAGDLALSAEIKNGVLKIEKFTSNGTDIDKLVLDGKVTLKEPWNSSVPDLSLIFKFADAYKGKDDNTKLVFGDPSGKGPPGMIDMQPDMKQARRPDGSYCFHFAGSLSALKKKPCAAEGSGAAKRSKGGDSPFNSGIRKASPTLPLGPSTAKGSDDAPAPIVPAPPGPPAGSREVPEVGRAADAPRRAPAMPEVVQPMGPGNLPLQPVAPQPTVAPEPAPAPAPEHTPPPEMPAPEQPAPAP